MECAQRSNLVACAAEIARLVNSLPRNTENPPARGRADLDVDTSASETQLAIHRSILASVAKIEALLSEPGYLLQQLSSRNQLLACLQWLGDFQVLAFIPLEGIARRRDIADLAGVPEPVLARVVRMTSTAGFLCEPKPHQIAHTSLSATFVTKPQFLDAAMFVAGTIAPAALHMTTATKQLMKQARAQQCSYTLASATGQSLQAECEQQPSLRRQRAAYLRWSANADDCVAEVLSRLDWGQMTKACVVEASSEPTALASVIAARHPTLNLVAQVSGPGTTTTSPADDDGAVRPTTHGVLVQVPSASAVGADYPVAETVMGGREGAQGADSGGCSSSSGSLSPSSSGSLVSGSSASRLTTHKRTIGHPQTVRDANVYVLHLGSPSPSPGESSASVLHRLKSELVAHLDVLRENRGAMLVLAMQLLPDPGSVDASFEAVARTRDLTLFQLANERDLEVSEVEELIKGIGDWRGRLTVVNRARGRNNAIVALGIKLEACS